MDVNTYFREKVSEVEKDSLIRIFNEIEKFHTLRNMKKTEITREIKRIIEGAVENGN